LYENPSQNHIEFQVWHCFHQLVGLGHMHLVHNLWVHNGGINGMEHYFDVTICDLVFAKYNVHKVDPKHQLCACATSNALTLG